MKMKKKKHWISAVYCESSAAKENEDANISWSNSDSEDNSKQHSVRKRARINNETLCEKRNNTWISVITPNQNLTPFNVTNNLPLEEASECEHNETFRESPVICGITYEKESPILLTCSLSSKERSPTLNNRGKILKKIKLRLGRHKQSTQIIQDASSPSDQLFISQTSNSVIGTPMEISQTKSEASQSCPIDPFPSQHSSETIDTGSSNVRSSLYHEPPPRKKRFRKGGLASQLRKAVEAQNASLAIWQHEVFLSKSRGEEIEPSVDGLAFEFSPTRKWKEYGCTVLECDVDEKVRTNFSDLKLENDIFLIIIGANVAINVCFIELNRYKLFPPYSTKAVDHNLKQTLCFINTSRFISV